jgi:hypothetical protein
MKNEMNTVNTRVEDARNSDVHVILAMEAIGQGLGDTFSLVIASPRANGIDMAPAEGGTCQWEDG